MPDGATAAPDRNDRVNLPSGPGIWLGAREGEEGQSVMSSDGVGQGVAAVPMSLHAVGGVQKKAAEDAPRKQDQVKESAVNLEAVGDVRNRTPTPGSVDANAPCEKDNVLGNRTRSRSTQSAQSHDVPMSPASSVAGSSSRASPLKKAAEPQTSKQQQRVLDTMQRVLEVDVLQSETADLHFKLEAQMESQHKCATPCGVWSGPDSNGETVQVRVCSQLSSARWTDSWKDENLLLEAGHHPLPVPE
jgi:hypothetical protein